MDYVHESEVEVGYGNDMNKRNGTVEKIPASQQNEIDLVGEMSEKERLGESKFKRLGWKRLTVILIVEAIALGSLSLPKAFSSLGMVAGVICTVGIGLIAIYTSWIVGKVKVMFPEITDYAEAGRLLCGRFGYEAVYLMLVLQLTLLTGSHTNTGEPQSFANMS